MITIMGISARNHKIDIDGATLEVTKHMASDPRRISGIDIKVNMPQISYTSKEKNPGKSRENLSRSFQSASGYHSKYRICLVWLVVYPNTEAVYLPESKTWSGLSESLSCEVMVKE